ncbi:MAG: hypothetical protein U1E65_07275 [Myxococcota bacterium]
MSLDPAAMRRLALRGTTLFLLFAIACGGGGGGGCGGGGGGCGGCSGTGNYRYPANDPNRPDAVLQREVARARITQSFIDFLKPQLPTLIKSALGSSAGMTVDANNVLHVALPDQDLFDIGVASAAMRGAEALIFLDDLDQRLDLHFEEPNGLRMTMTNLRVGLNLKLREDALGSTSSCPIIGTLGSGPVHHAAEITINTLIEPGVGPDPDRNFDVAITVDDIALNDLAIDVAGSSVYCNEPECQDCALEVGGTCLDPGGRCVECRTFCGGITNGLLSLVTSLIDLVRPLLNRVLKPVISNFVQSALASLNNRPAKLEMQIGLADLMPIDAFKYANKFGVFIAPEVGKFPVVNRMGNEGMEVTMTGGAEAELADCIPPLDPFFEPKGPTPVLGGVDARGRPYHIGFTIAQSMINQILYAVYRSGSLCLKITSQDVKQLTGGSFSLNASVLSLLASDLSKLATDTAPVIVQLKPRHPPVIDLGSGLKTGVDANGKDVYDWLLKLNMQEVGIAFHVLIHDRFVRIFEVTSNVNVGLNVNILPDNKLEVAVGKLDINGFTEVFNEILPNADFGMLLPTLLDVALQALLTRDLTFNVDISDTVSNALGGAPIFMRINEIKRDGAQEDFLTMTMTFTSSRTHNLTLSAETLARLDDERPDVEERTDGIARPTGHARVKVSENLSSSQRAELEYQARVDGGLWHVFEQAQPDGTIVVEDGHLRLAGDHVIEVRARYTDDYRTLDPSPAKVPVLIDTVAPHVSGELALDKVAITVTDAGSKPSLLKLSGRFDDGAWFDIPLGATVDAAKAELPLAGVSAHILELVATDGRENRSQVERVVVGAAGLTADAHPEPKTSEGCSATGRGGLVEFAALAALGLLFTKRRRR